MKTNSDWKPITIDFNADMIDAIQQQHHAAQFIALAGHFLIPQEADDSNTNMEYVSDGDMLLGNALPNGFRIALRLTNLRIWILDKQNHIKKIIDLEGKTKTEVFTDLKQNLFDLGVDVSDFKNELHYEIPSHLLNTDARFSLADKSYLNENSIYRHNANLIITELVKSIKNAEAVKIWPHHFDTGSFIPLSHNEKNELIQSIGIGWSIPDEMVNEPYFYLSFWSKAPIEDLKSLPELSAGQWMMPTWNGAILRLSEIKKTPSANEQYALVKSFFTSGIKILMDRLK